MPSRIEDYALIGDGHTAALVAKDGSVDWLCWPRFDSAACFAALLGTPEHGRWRIAPAETPSQVRRHYRDGTLILETDFDTSTGSVTVVDFMPLRNGWSELIRIVIGKRGTVDMKMEMALRFDYGAAVPWVTRLPDDSGLRAIAGPDMVILRTPVNLVGVNMHTEAEFRVEAGQMVPFTLAYAPSHHSPPPAGNPRNALAKTENYWREWSGRSTVQGQYADAVQRSLITLKALAYEPTGGIVAAPTTSLPEAIGGTRNWDYRYTWLRDATITLLALMRCGYYDEAGKWRDWLARAIAGSPDQLRIMYGLAGERRLPEWEVPWLPGYENSKPVRIGNQAVDQLQLDVYGEVMNALYVARAGGLPADEASWPIQNSLVDHLGKIWTQPDEGIWEVRGGRQHFTFSKIMAWVAVDRAVKSIERFGLEGPLDEWRTLRDRIHADVCANAWNSKLQAFTQAYGGNNLDASVLLMPLLGFLPATDPRVRTTIEAIERELTDGGLILRYRSEHTADGLPPGEGTFLACSFWMSNCLALIGRRDDAHALYERLLALRNDVGLLAEEYDVPRQRQVGNFPQAFSHVALIHTGLNLMRHEVGMTPTHEASGEGAGGATADATA